MLAGIGIAEPLIGRLQVYTREMGCASSRSQGPNCASAGNPTVTS